MFFYSVILMLSVSGMLTIYIRNREVFYAFNFAAFMESLRSEAQTIWHAHFREQFFLSLEKILHSARIWFLKMESFLFHTIRKLRGFKEKNGNGADNSDTI